MDDRTLLLNAFEEYLARRPLMNAGDASRSIYANFFAQHIALPRAWNEFNNKAYQPVSAFSRAKLYCVACLWLLVGAGAFAAVFVAWSFVRRPSKLQLGCNYNEIAIATCNTSRRRLEKFSQVSNRRIPIIAHDLGTSPWRAVKNSRGVSVYDALTTRELMAAITSVLQAGVIASSLKEVFEISNCNFVSLRFIKYAAVRVVYDSITQKVLEKFFDKARVRTVIAGCTNERYGVYLGRICSHLGIKTICIPHGVSPALVLPNGVFGDKYYCLSQAEKISLDRNYPGQEHVLDEGLILDLFSIESESKTELCAKAVVATSSRDYQGDQALIDWVSKSTAEFGLRLHPNDSIVNYKIPANCKLVSDFSEAVCGVVLFVKLSAMTIDAVINGSRVYVVLTTLQDHFDYRFLYGSAVHPEAIVLERHESIGAVLRDG
jgi:hypothetical protein